MSECNVNNIFYRNTFYQDKRNAIMSACRQSVVTKHGLHKALRVHRSAQELTKRMWHPESVDQLRKDEVLWANDSPW